MKITFAPQIRAALRAVVSTLCALLVILPDASAASPFTPGNLVILRAGDGSATLVTSGSAAFLDEYTASGTFVQSVALPTTATGSQKALLLNGTASSEGYLTRSADGACLLVPGYGRNIGGSGSLSSATSTDAPRSVGRVLADATFDTSTATDALSGSNYRGAASDNCSRFWLTGGAGVAYVSALGATTSANITNSLPAASRTVGIFGGQLYMVSNSTNSKGVSTVGSGLPTAATQTVTRLPGMTDASMPSNFGFFFADLDPNVPGVDTLYVADDGTGTALIGGIAKYSFDGTTWTARGNVGVSTELYKGLTGIVNGNSVTLYAIRNSATSASGPGGDLVTLTDSTGRTGTLVAAPAATATAVSAGTKKSFRGIAFVPHQVVVTPSAGDNGTISPNTPQTVAGESNPVFTVTPAAGYTAVVGGTCTGTLSGTTFTLNAVTASCTVDMNFAQQPFIVTPSTDGNGSGTINPGTPQSLVPGQTKTFIVTPATGSSVAMGGTCGGLLTGSSYLTDPVMADCTVIAKFTLNIYTVTPSAGLHGTISPDTGQSVNHGQTQPFTVTPDSGYYAQVGGTCGGSLAGFTYTTNPVTADCSVDATFAVLPVVTANAGTHAAISPSGSQSVAPGSTPSFTITADAGFTAVGRGTCGGAMTGNVYTTLPITADCTVTAVVFTKRILFQGNSYTFGRVNPVMQYNAANVDDLTWSMWLANADGTNEDEPHPWGGIPGVFKKLTDEAGFDFAVSISARNAASLRGHYLNSNPAGWDLRDNVASQNWDVVVLQDLSDEPLPAGRSTNANLPYFNAYADKFEQWVHAGASESYTETQLFGGGNAATCQAVTGASAATCNTTRTISPANANANAATDVYLYQTWARPDMIAPNGTNADGTTYTAAEGLETMTGDFHASYFGRFAANGNFKGVSPVGDAFLRAVTEGVAMRDPYVPEAGKINLWHTDFFHPSKYGSYLSALTHFARITGVDPTTFGAGEQAASDMGISSADALTLQHIAKLTVSPGAPGIGTAVAGDGQVTVPLTAPVNTGNLPITGYTATCGAQSAAGVPPSITVAGVPNGTAVTCFVTATNSVGTSVPSSLSNGVTPAGNQTIDFPAVGPQPFGAGATFQVAATATSGLVVSLVALTTGTCTVAGTTVTTLAVGTCTLRATQGGNAAFNPAPPVERDIAIVAPTLAISPVSLPAGTIATTYPNQNLGATGGTPPYTFTVPPGTLPPGLSLASGGTLSGTPTVAGTFAFTVTATDSSGPAQGGPFTGTRDYSMTIAKLSATVSLVSNFNPSAPGQTVTLTATLGSLSPAPAGTIDFNEGATVLCAAVPVFVGEASCATAALPAGTHSLTAVFSGDASYTGATSPTFLQTVGAASANVLTVTRNGSGSGTVASILPGIDCGVDCTEPYPSPTAVTLYATADAGSIFTGWLGSCTGTENCSVTVNGATAVSATFAPDNTPLRVDVDGDGHYDALTDGFIVDRYLLGLRGAPLTAGGLRPSATRTQPEQIAAFLDDIRPLLDIDGNGVVDPQTDGLLLLRYLFGLRGDALIGNAVGTGATRTTANDIENYLESITPPIP